MRRTLVLVLVFILGILGGRMFQSNERKKPLLTVVSVDLTMGKMTLDHTNGIHEICDRVAINHHTYGNTFQFMCYEKEGNPYGHEQPRLSK